MSYRYVTDATTRQRTGIESFKTDEPLQPGDSLWINGGVHSIESLSWDRMVAFAKPGPFITAYDATFVLPEPAQ